ncbi:FG-GAP repeat domain-containing protein [Spirosoma utsteinense]|uniref:VCBS repeat-containing protein n=1 Tax=Spirosoma utsteinense TaxID=2585773 RepID=A0ABR6W9D9_9BACT|nr:VCBS repeat-containing protein [Spirosoma utsteinense]MBC3784133.1 hypothetical protein [Spirosoma utsteinense]MBC3792778.1 hypothetical protein [Spirosoma utsteinense]
MRRIVSSLFVVLVMVGAVAPEPTVRFSRYFVAAESYESVAVFDVDQNDTLDIVSGDFWYEGPRFRKRHLIGNQPRHDQYYDDFSTIPMDVNGDGRQDFVTGGWFGGTLRWLENPGKDARWSIHTIASVGNVETARAWDVDGDGKLDVVPNNPNHPLKYVTLKKPGPDSAGRFQIVTVAPTQDHGLGFGDINGDGRGDLIVSKGWLEAPADRTAGPWTLHPEFSLGTASVPIIVTDVNGDRLNDLIVGQGHSYGLHWYEQIRDGSGKRSWTKHLIDDKNSQYHCLEWVDITGDGRPELLTGKRYRAHNGNDPGEEDPVGLYYFTWNAGKKQFVKHDIAYGPAGVGKGTGIYFAIADLRKTGRSDIVVAGKDGLTVFFNEGRK